MKPPLLQDRLLINRFILAQFGIEQPDTLFHHMANIREGTTTDGQSFFCQAIKTFASIERSLGNKLDDYDRRINEYVACLNYQRHPMQLRYFQYLAVLFAEIYLDRLFTDRSQLLAEIHAYGQTLNAQLPAKARPYPTIQADDLNKLAFWMATGSGKTLLLHINYWQYLHYSQQTKPDNIILLTPYESLSAQHAVELHASGIVHRRYDEPTSILLNDQDKDAIQLLEITKLVQKKVGKGSQIEVSELGANNLLFVDEGHRGASGDVWRQLRADVAQHGFTFEYSATFGQIVNGATSSKRPILLDEYSKSILFDYSYPHFHSDGYGKDYWIVNWSSDTPDMNTWIMAGNLLAFYEQVFTYQEHGDSYRPYNLEAPLWVFVGHSVISGKTKEDRTTLTDVQEVIAFFTDFLVNRDTWVDHLAHLLAGTTPLKQNGTDTFETQFTLVKKSGLSPDQIYDDIVQRIFHGQLGETLRIFKIQDVEKEIGLRVGADNPPFGVIRIGNISELARLLETNNLHVTLERLGDSLFDTINRRDSSINVLVGSRMFMEGWDCYRVSSMGLLNLGRGEGSQIIQLFGRGVRLRGQHNTLKRSAALDPAARPPHIDLLETLKVFGIRADYMSQFRTILRQEGVEPDIEEVDVPININSGLLAHTLQIPHIQTDKQFVAEQTVILTVDQHITVSLDLVPKLEKLSGTEDTKGKLQAVDNMYTLRERLGFLNWTAIYHEMLTYRHQQGFINLAFSPSILRTILEKAHIRLVCLDEQLQIHSGIGTGALQGIAITLLKKYINRYYDRCRRAWEQHYLKLKTLDPTHPNLNWQTYHIHVAPTFVATIQHLISQAHTLSLLDEKKYPHVYFDRHLYQPLIANDQGASWLHTIYPPGLNKGEVQLIHHIRGMLTNTHRSQPYQNWRIILLRNLAKVGIYFFDPDEGSTFYPDFILWIIENNVQKIVFLDPHGIRNERWNGPKLTLYQRLEQEWTPILNAQTTAWDLHITSFIISPTSYADLAGSWVHDHTEADFKAHHVLFQDPNGEYITEIFEMLRI